MTDDFPSFYAEDKDRVEAALRRQLPSDDTSPARLHAAMRYSTLNGGKRIRGVLALEAARMGPEDHARAAETAAAALEMIHAYSLVHDDLPAMDDDDYRRGMPSCHRRFDVRVAILCGSALYARAVELLGRLNETDLPADRVTAMLQDAARLTGSRGLMGGQHDDFGLTDETVDETRVRDVYRRKTGSLLALSLLAGGRVGGLGTEAIEQLETVGITAGVAFQIRDDLLEREGDFDRLGKDVQSDRDAGKQTYPAVVGPEEADDRLDDLVARCRSLLADLPADTSRLRQLIDLIVERKY